MTFPVQVATRAKSTPVKSLALASLRYEAVRGLSAKQLAALNRSALMNPKRNETFEAAFDRIVDTVIVSNAAKEREKT